MKLADYITVVLNELNGTAVLGNVEFVVSLSPDGEVVSDGSNIIKFELIKFEFISEEPEEDK